MRTKGTLSEQVKAHAVREPELDCDVNTNPVQFIPTGLGVFNMALSDRVEGGFLPGTIANLIGDSSTGKTLCAYNIFAEVCRIPYFDNHELIHDDIESALTFDVARMFGQKTADRVRPPQGTVDNPIPSDTLQKLQLNLHKRLTAKEPRPFIYIVDSLDALTSLEEKAETDANMKALDKGNDINGSYGMAKAKAMSSMLRQITQQIKTTDSFVLIISQTRDNTQRMSSWSDAKKVRSGGKALEFYCSQIVWLDHAGQIKNEDVKLVIGNRTRARITKNRCNGKYRVVEWSTYYDYGTDDIGSMVDFCIEHKLWGNQKPNVGFDTGAVGIIGRRDEIVTKIEEEGRIDRLRRVVQNLWNRIEDSVKLHRRPKYQ